MDYLRFILLFILLGGSILFCTKKLRFSQSLAPLVVILANTLLLYLFSLINFLLPGTYLLAGINLLLGVFSFVNWPKQKETEKFVLSPVLLTWIVIFAILIVYTRGMLFYGWDEFSYWGVISKYLLATNHLPDQASNFLAITYPPFLSLFHYFVSIIVSDHESSAYFAQMLLSFSALIAIFPHIDWKSWKKFILFFAVGLISIFVFDFKLQSVYSDLVMGLFFAASLTAIGFDEKLPADRFVVVLLTATAMAIVRPLGILFSLVSLGLLFYKLARTNFQTGSFGKVIRSILKPFSSVQFLLVLIIPIVVMFSWSIHSAPYSTETIKLSLDAPSSLSDSDFWYPAKYTGTLTDQELVIKANRYLFNNTHIINVSAKSLVDNFSSIADDRTKQIVRNFVLKISSVTYYGFPLTIIEAILAIILISLLLMKLTRGTGTKENNYLLGATVILAICWVLYTLSLLVVYIYYFYPNEALSVPSIDRYSASFLLAWWFFVLNFAFRNDSLEIPLLKIKSADAIMAAVLVLFLIKIPMISYLHLPYAPDPQRFAISRVYKEIKGELTSANEKVYDVWDSDKSEGLNHLILKYFLAPVPSNNFGWEIGETAVDYNLYKVDFASREWLSLLNDQHYTHVLVCSGDDGFWDKYGKLFDTFSRNEYPQLFLVTPDKLINVELPAAEN